MRHHVMSHLAYQPYQCPYCQAYTAIRRNVVNNHIKVKHPGLEVKSLCNRVQAMEIQVKNSYSKLSYSENSEQKSAPFNYLASGKKQQRIYKSTQYRCCFCSLTTTFLRDIKQHLMREIDYRPFNCSLCSYRDSSEPVVKRHCLKKHKKIAMVANMVVECDIQLQDLLTQCTFVVYKEGRSNTSASAPAIKKEYEAPHSDIPILKISNRKDTLKSSLVYKRKVHTCEMCGFGDCDVRRVVLHRLKCQPRRRQCPLCCHCNSNLMQLRRHVVRCRVKRMACTTNTSFKATAKADTSKTACHLQNRACRQKAQRLVYCCHLCSSTFTDIRLFSSHLQTFHFNPPEIRILEDCSGVEFKRLHQCGLCPFTSVSKDLFEAHVNQHTGLPPALRCSLCSYASFSPFKMQEHLCCHQHSPHAHYRILNDPYTMTPPAPPMPINFFPYVKLTDMKDCLNQ